MSDCSPGCGAAMADSQLFNTKQLQDMTTIMLFNSVLLGQQAVIDNQADARRRMSLNGGVDGANLVNNTTADQTGATQNQQTNSASRTAAADGTFFQPVGAGYPPNRQTDSGLAEWQRTTQMLITQMQGIANNLAARAAGTGAQAAGSPQPAPSTQSGATS